MIDYCEHEEERLHIQREWMREIELRELELRRKHRRWDTIMALGVAVLLGAAMWLLAWAGEVTR